MASSHFRINQDELICAICLVSMVERDPRMLNCQHTYCLQCLRCLESEKKIFCPLCKKVTVIPKDGIDKLPTNLLMNSLEIIPGDNEICLKHKKNIIKPIFYCKKCKIKVNCSDCIEEDHSNVNCNLIPHKIIKELNGKCKKSIEKQRKKDKTKMKLLLNTIFDYKRNCNKLIDNKFNEIERKIKRYFNKREVYYNQFNCHDEDIFLKEKQIFDYLDKLSNENIIVNNLPELSLDINLEIVNTPEKIQRFTKKLNFIEKKEIFFGSKLTLTRIGMYFLAYFSLEDKTILYWPFDNNLKKEIHLDREVTDFRITKNIVYAHCKANFTLYHAKIDFDKKIILKLFSNNISKLYAATETDDNDIYILALTRKNFLRYFLNNHTKWFKADISPGRIKDACIYNNGNPLINIDNREIYILEKNS